MERTVWKKFPVDRADRVDVLNQLRTVIGPLVPIAARFDAETASFGWIEGDVPAVEADLPDHALLVVGRVLAQMHLAARAFPPSWGVNSIADLPGTIARLKASATTVGMTLDLTDRAAEWTMTWTHGDIAPANIVFRDGWHDIAGVIDWEFMDWDLPILDVAHALWRIAGWSNWKAGSPNWERRRVRTVNLLDGYGWVGSLDNLIVALHFLLSRRIEVIIEADRAAPGSLPRDWTEELERCRYDMEMIGLNARRYRGLVNEPFRVNDG